MVPVQTLLTSLGAVIRKLRDEAGYSQERFAHAIKRHRTYMGLIERGKANPTVKTLHRVAEALGLTVPELFALTAAEGSSALSGGGRDRVRQVKSLPVQEPPPTGASRKGAIQMARRSRQTRRKPGK